MVSAKEISAQGLIDGMASEIKKNPEMAMPEWANFVKTGAHAQRKPQNPDWWYIRSASLVRKLYIEGNLGVGALRSWYGGAKNRGSRPERHTKASGHIIRTIFQQLEKAGLVKKEKTGRVLTPQGRSLVDRHVLAIRPKAKRSMAKEEPKQAKDEKKPAKKEAKGETKDAKSGGGAKPAGKAKAGSAKKASRTAKTSAAKKPSGAKGKGKADKDKPSGSGKGKKS